MSQGRLNLFRSVCGEQYSFEPSWEQLDRGKYHLGVDWSPLFCALPPHHDGRHIDEKTGIPWDRPEDLEDIDDVPA